MSPNRLKEYLDKAEDSISLDAFVRTSDDDVTLMDAVSDKYDLFDDVQWAIDVEQVSVLMTHLNDREKYIVAGAFALEGGEPKTFQAMGKELGMSRERARNIYHRAVRHMRLKANKNKGISYEL